MTVTDDWEEEMTLDDEGRDAIVSLRELRESGWSEQEIRDIQHPRDPETGRFITRTYEVVD